MSRQIVVDVHTPDAEQKITIDVPDGVSADVTVDNYDFTVIFVEKDGMVWVDNSAGMEVLETSR